MVVTSGPCILYNIGTLAGGVKSAAQRMWRVRPSWLRTKVGLRFGRSVDSARVAEADPDVPNLSLAQPSLIPY